MIFLPQFISEGIYKERIPTINYLFTLGVKMGFPGNSAGKEIACNAGDPGLIPERRSSPVEGIAYPCQYFPPSLVAQSVKNPPAVRTWVDPWVGKIPWRRTWQSTPVSLPRESPWTEKPGGLQFMQRVGHDLVTKSTHTAKISLDHGTVYFMIYC